ncbi:hypothetical protein ACET3Z_030396 [Daucus carota]
MRRTTARSRVHSSGSRSSEARAIRNINKINSNDNNLISRLNNNRRAFLVLVIISIILIYRILESSADDPMERVVTPFPSPRLMDLPMFQGEHKESLYWGTYRPQVYLGIRARVPQSLVAGMMWIIYKEGRYFIRHVCQDSDELKKYGWTYHNGRDYGHQDLVDQDMTLGVSFLKSKGDYSGYGGDWVVRGDVQLENFKEEKAHLFFYIADEGGNALSLGRGVMGNSYISVLASGSRSDVGSWELHLKSKDDLEVHYAGFKTPDVYKLTDLVLENVAAHAKVDDNLQLTDTFDASPNILVFQMSSKISFTADIAFVSGTGSDNSRVKERVRSLTGTSLTTQLNAKQDELDDKFKKFFSTSKKLKNESMEVGKAAIGNLIGGIGYFYGQSKISLPTNTNHKLDDDVLLYWPAELYTAVPSRPFFPRGFLWDEGFHQLVIRQWDIPICLDIVGHWLDLMNIDGWIPREQILGAEALSKVPAEAVVQHPDNGNPPALFMVLQDLVCSMKKKKFSESEEKQVSSFLERAFVRLDAWFQWFNTTQSGKAESSYYWHGRDNITIRQLNPQTLTSGFDDYPRASHPNDEERHVDLRCWMFLAAESMYSISEFLEMESLRGKEYKLMSKVFSDIELLNQMHFDNGYGAYFDFGNHTEKVRLAWKLVEGPNNILSRQLIREVLEEPVLRFVPHIGYVSLFPFIWKIIPPQSWILEKQLNLISDETILWSDFGIRSLAKTSSLYMKYNTEHDAPYWRGSIWINMNYLILSSLHHYSKENGPYRERAEMIYNDLRNNLISNIVKNYQQTGYFWEQYDQDTGKGKGARVFTGWTSLVLLIMAESYGNC